VNEAIIDDLDRAVRGGSFYNESLYLAAADREEVFPSDEYPTIGFRLAMIPEPSTGLLVIAGLLGLAGWRRASD